eukprot:246856-Pelagomonas_calceolata.AAC.3
MVAWTGVERLRLGLHRPPPPLDMVREQDMVRDLVREDMIRVMINKVMVRELDMVREQEQAKRLEHKKKYMNMLREQEQVKRLGYKEKLTTHVAQARMLTWCWTC